MIPVPVADYETQLIQQRTNMVIPFISTAISLCRNTFLATVHSLSFNHSGAAFWNSSQYYTTATTTRQNTKPSKQPHTKQHPFAVLYNHEEWMWLETPLGEIQDAHENLDTTDSSILCKDKRSFSVSTFSGWVLGSNQSLLCQLCHSSHNAWPRGEREQHCQWRFILTTFLHPQFLIKRTTVHTHKATSTSMMHWVINEKFITWKLLDKHQQPR